MTHEERAELEQLYPVTTNRELSRRFDISVDAIQDHFAKPLGWKKDMKTVRQGNRGGRTLTEKEVQWIVKHYKHTKNEDIMRRFDIGESSVHRIARKYGLKKSKQQMNKTLAATTKVAYQVCKDYGIYAENAERARQQWHDMEEEERRRRCFKPGESNKDRLTPRRFRECMRKIHEKRNESIRKDRIRLNWGLPQKLKLKLSMTDEKTRKRKIYYRWMLHKRNYIVERGSMTVWYDEETDRNEPLEQRAKANGFTILSDMGDQPTVTEHVTAIHGPRHYEGWHQ